jgi:protein phosphatase
MSPSETTEEPGYLEYPREAFDYFRKSGVDRVVCQTKHMGSRAVVVVCRDEAASVRRFGARGALGVCYTRTGRRFFDDEGLHSSFVLEVSQAIGRAGLWDELETDWVCLDAELMPWNAKAQSLLREQYAPVGAAARLSLVAAVEAVRRATERGLPLGDLIARLEQRRTDVEHYVEAYGRYCWDTNGLQDLKLAPFHLLASEGRTYFDRDHEWHVAALARLSDAGGLFRGTESRTVDLTDETSCEAATRWWLKYTGEGGEGMVVKPLQFIVRGPKGTAQPAVKVRGRDYLRIIYGPEYTEPENLERLRKRGLHSKRALAVREFALGVEGLERFVRREPLRLVHECVFAVLALESEPVDPRL